MRQKTHDLLLDGLTLDASTDDPRSFADGLLSLVGDDMHAHRCSLMMRTRRRVFAHGAARGWRPASPGHARAIGRGVAGKATRRALLCATHRGERHPTERQLLRRSFISFIVYHDELVGVVVRQPRHAACSADVDRVRILGLVIALVASNARLPERLVEALSVR